MKLSDKWLGPQMGYREWTEGWWWWLAAPAEVFVGEVDVSGDGAGEGIGDSGEGWSVDSGGGAMVGYRRCYCSVV